MAKSKSAKKTMTALSLQGGGARGAYEYGVLKALYEHRGTGFCPRVVTGVSIGAINAALLVGAKGDPMEALDLLWRERFCVSWPWGPWGLWASWMPSGSHYTDFNPHTSLADWSQQSLAVFGNPGMYSLKPEFFFVPFSAPMLTSSVYDTSLLKKTLEELIDPEKLNRPDQTRLIVSAVNVQTGHYVRFDNARTRLTIDHIIASGSFPVTFPMTPIGGNFYWDGGIFMNMPMGVAVNAIEQIEPENSDIVREIILVALHRPEGALPTNIPEASERFYNLLFSGKFSLDRKLFSRYDAFVEVMQEIDKSLPADSPVRRHEGYRELIRHRKIDRTIIIGEEGTGATGSGSDFSPKMLARRIADGFNDAMAYFKNTSS